MTSQLNIRKKSLIQMAGYLHRSSSISPEIFNFVLLFSCIDRAKQHKRGYSSNNIRSTGWLLKKLVMQERKTTSTNYFNQSFLGQKCALNELIYLLSKRWMTEVLFSIEDGNNRFSAIKEDLIHISDHILADRLRLLESNGFINKKVFGDVPPRAEYNLTEKGEELSSLLGGLCDFAETTVMSCKAQQDEPKVNFQEMPRESF